MYLFSIVARENFISIVMDAYPLGNEMEESSLIREISPDQAFYIFEGPSIFGELGWDTASRLADSGTPFKEIAAGIARAWENFGADEPMEAVIGGISSEGVIEYHIISPGEEIQSYYPQPGESLYYANDLQLGIKPMEELARTLMMRGMSTSGQAQEAQFDLFSQFAGVHPGSASHPHSLVIEKHQNDTC